MSPLSPPPGEDECQQFSEESGHLGTTKRNFNLKRLPKVLQGPTVLGPLSGLDVKIASRGSEPPGHY